MKVTVLIENTGCDDLVCEHGLSLYLETEQSNILFDMGQGDGFYKNALAMGIDIKNSDFAVLSHGHYDHGGGLEALLSLNCDFPIYISKHGFEPHWNVEGKYIGLEPSLSKTSFIFVDRELTPGEKERIFTIENLKYPIEPYGLGMGEDEIVAEDFRHEQYLLVEEKGKRILISGCSHKGILNIMAEVKPDVLIGGFHFMKIDPSSPELCRFAEELKQYNCLYYTCHCTGIEQFDTLKKIMGDKLNYISTGDVFEV